MSVAPTARLFVALWPDERGRDALAASASEWHFSSGAARVRPERLHLTLHFLGEVGEPETQALVARLPPAETFTLRLARADCWPQGVAVLEAGEPPPELLRLHAALADTLHGLGLRVEARRFRPHVTLARHAQGAQAPELPEAIEWPVRGYALVRSHAGPPLRYEAMASVRG